MNPIGTITNLITESAGKPLKGEDLKTLYDCNHSIWRGVDLALACDYEELLKGDMSDELRRQMTFARINAFSFQARHANMFIEKFHDIVSPQSQPRFFEHTSKSFFMVPVHPGGDGAVRESGMLTTDEMLYKLLYVGSADLTPQELLAIAATSDVMSDKNIRNLMDVLIDKCDRPEITRQALTGVVPPLFDYEHFSPLLGSGCDITLDKMLAHYQSQGGALTDAVTLEGQSVELGSLLFTYLIAYEQGNAGKSVEALIRHGLNVTDNQQEEFSPASIVNKLKPELLKTLEHYSLLKSVESAIDDDGTASRSDEPDAGEVFRI